jgi:iron(III) transport system ATP-binding protein
MTGSSIGAAKAIEFDDVSYAYGENVVLRAVSLSLESGKVLALLGPSGCGKTTLLKLVAGLGSPSSGFISIQGTVVADAQRKINLPPEQRKLGMVFQDYALWPHLSVADNVGFPLDVRGGDRRNRRVQVSEALGLVGLAGFEDRSPSSLSGGQQQRVAIARAIVARPAVVLFDEPLSNLDPQLRGDLAEEISTLVRDVGLTAIYVTHDQSEALVIADQIAVILNGKLAQVAEPKKLIEHPETEAVADFLRLGTIATAERKNGSWVLAGTEIVLADSGAEDGATATRRRVLIGRDAARLAEGHTGASGTVTKSTYRGNGYLLKVGLGDEANAIQITLASDQPVAQGTRLNFDIHPSRLRWFPPAAT